MQGSALAQGSAWLPAWGSAQARGSAGLVAQARGCVGLLARGSAGTGSAVLVAGGVRCSILTTGRAGVTTRDGSLLTTHVARGSMTLAGESEASLDCIVGVGVGGSASSGPACKDQQSRKPYPH